MPKRQKISRKLARVFLLQIAFISLAALLGVIAARYVLGGILIQQALRDEASYFWDRYHEDSSASLPDTHNMKAYMTPLQAPEQIPAEIRDLSNGVHELQREHSFAVAYVTADGPSRLFLVFDGQRVEELALYFGMIPLAAGLIGIYVAAFIGYRLSRRVVSPILALAQQVDRIQREAPDKSLLALEQFPPGDDDEVRALSQALSRLAARIQRFIERERTFTRDVSHELRSPITVIRMATDFLLNEQELADASRSYLFRIKRAALDMEELTNAFLLLSREAERDLPAQLVCINDVVQDEMERAKSLLGDKRIEVSMIQEGRWCLLASEKVLSILVGNLIRNAYTYTKAGYVRVTITAKHLQIEDSGTGIADEDMNKVFQPHFRGTGQGRGYGVGLTIVKRLSDRFGWPLSLASKAGAGTTASVEFPEAVAEKA